MSSRSAHPKPLKPSRPSRRAEDVVSSKLRASEEEERALGELAQAWHDDPVAFSEDVLGIRPWKRQAELLRAAANNARVAVRSGHKTGKSTSAAILALWFWATRKDARVILTAPTGRQVDEVLWREVTRLYRGARIPLGGRIYQTPSSGLVDPSSGSQIFGFATDEPDKFSGISGANVLYIIDEASGIPEPIFEAIGGARMGGARLVLTGNPTQTSGTFYDAFHGKLHLWCTLHISSEESPNYTEKRNVIEGLAQYSEIISARAEWGAESVAYGIRVLGNFPSTSASSLYSVTMLDAAERMWGNGPTADDLAARLVIGVDVARFGDDETVIIGRRKNYVYQPLVLHGLDVMAVASRVESFVKSHLHHSELHSRGKPVAVIDEIGIGAGVVDALKRSPCVEVEGCNVASNALDQEAYTNKRAEIWVAGRDFLVAGGTLPPDLKLRAELLAVKYGFDARGRYKIESKADLKKRLGRSPDRADAFLYCVVTPRAFVPRPMSVRGLSV